MILFRGKVPMLVAIPVFGQLSALINIDALKAELAGLLQLSINFTPPSIKGILDFTAALNLALPSFTPPSVDFKADLLLKIGLLKAKIELILKITQIVFGGSVGVYEYDGLPGNFGPELNSTMLGPEPDGGLPPSKNIFGVILVAEAGTSGEVALKAVRQGV